MTKEKILKVKIGEVFIDGKTYSVYQTAWRTEKGHFVMNVPVFVNEVEKKPKENNKTDL